MIKHRASLAMSAALAMAALASMPAQAGESRTVTRPPPRRRVATAVESATTELQREIAEWNAAVETRKTEKRRLRGA